MQVLFQRGSFWEDPSQTLEGAQKPHAVLWPFSDAAEAEKADAVFGYASDRYHSLNGIWKFSYASNYNMAPQNFYKEDFDCHSFGEIHVPAHIQMEGYDVPAYVNTQYPWEGRDEISPGEIPAYLNPTACYVKSLRFPSPAPFSGGMNR